MGTNASYADHSQDPPQIDVQGAKTWLTRGANFVIAVTQAEPGQLLQRDDQADEYLLFLPAIGASIEAGLEQLEAGPESVTIIPPGPSQVRVTGSGLVVRVFTHRAEDLLALAGNAAVYADGAPAVAPLSPWPAPHDGFRLRHYRVAEHDQPGSNMRLFRSAELMINVLKRRNVTRDVSKLSPHTHADFEQASLVVEGSYMHHLRWPWSPDMNSWRDDQHAEMASPSVLIIPPGVLHTSMNINGPGWLVDIFAPPRLDFLARPGLVCNADEYPLPAGIDLSLYADSGAA